VLDCWILIAWEIGVLGGIFWWDFGRGVETLKISKKLKKTLKASLSF
jgi:hypothetical protein